MNHTNIIFNERFRDSVFDFYDRHVKPQGNFIDMSSCDISIKQQTLNKLIDKEIDITYGEDKKNRKTRNFAIFALMLCRNYNSINSWEDVTKYFKGINKEEEGVYNNDWFHLEHYRKNMIMEEGVEVKCACGQPNCMSHFSGKLSNNDRTITLLFGSTCIEKIGVSNFKKDCVQLLKDNEKKREEMRVNSLCIICKTEPKYERGEYCNKCYREHNIYQKTRTECRSCGKMKAKKGFKYCWDCKI